ncbi:MAG: hypothetical protein Q8839_00425 [Candidatus Phytoplasma australasiaticum]|nr:hypothetical protein [Candidatus Phytoplasma australasiaticum]MDV3180707.1 hypothetical protein [Candidatus Phytoplasma australasiaticum]MDV3182894.1 hypothetical protein [Candidatus Phytoplasma australasiaticum]MDV3185456.1 hypothetical protein [Candidatus Phytoplasma australasiaticum]MDV3185926.1 hypothetical protein [Candidatus Phytoplasma australasiaticum]
MNIKKIFNYRIIVSIFNLLLIGGMLFAIYANSRKQQQSNEIKLFSDNKLSSNNKYNDDLKKFISEKSSFSIDQELFDSFRNALRKKIFNNGELVGFKIYEHSYDHFPIMFEEYNKKNFLKKVTKYNNIDGIKLYNIEYIYDKSKVINKVKKIYNNLEQIIQIEEYNVDYSLYQQQPIDLLMKVTKYKNLNNISSIIEYIYDNKSKKVINKNVNIYNDSGKLLSKESYNIIDGSDIPFLRKKIGYSTKNGIIESIVEYFELSDNKQATIIRLFNNGVLTKTIKKETDLLANKVTKIVYKDGNNKVFRIDTYDVQKQVWCSDVYKNGIIVDKRCEDKINNSYKHYQKSQNKDDLLLMDEKVLDKQNNVVDKQYIYKADGELKTISSKTNFY